MLLDQLRMKKPIVGAKRGRKPKFTRAMTIELHPKAYSWLEALFAKGRFGNSVEDVVVYLLNERFKQLLQEGELREMPAVEGAIPFPNQTEHTKEHKKNTDNLNR